ncbi:MAG: creatininase family protein [Rhodobacteraceae bacterium]|nr:creatininase family protein [Paracoccaceae bacterium]
MPQSRIFANLTQPEIAAQFERNPLILLPTGSVEQHGAHLPTGTDSFAAELVAEAVARRMDGVVLPGPMVGVTPMHMPYAGTVTFKPDTYIRVVTEVCESAASHGAKLLMIVNWHEGNIPSLAIAAEDLHRRVGLTVLTVQACYVAEELYGGQCNGLTHGGEIEALAVLATRPELVHLDRAGHSSDLRQGSHMDKLRRTRSFQPVLTDIRNIAPTGWYGDPSSATIERGIAMVDRIAEAIATEATELFVQLGRALGGTAEVKHLHGAK